MPTRKTEHRKLLITGADGFIGKNLRLLLRERKDLEIVAFTRNDDPSQLRSILSETEFVFHFAGVNRPKDPTDFSVGNAELTRALAEALRTTAETLGRKVPVVFTSSTQAALDNPYGQSKRAAEHELFAVREAAAVPVHIFRLPNVFGKWSRPNYNSAVATFCHNIARDLPIQVSDSMAPLTLVYVEDVVQEFERILNGGAPSVNSDGFCVVPTQYATSVGEVANIIREFRSSRTSLLIPPVGTGLTRALYSTYVSFLPESSFAYEVPQHKDQRGMFVEMLKTRDSGQFSFFTAHPGVTRGGHYHHSKTEKFLVLRGTAKFRFKNMGSGATYELTTSGDKSEIVETVPGWSHDITNDGDDELIVMLWANEIFDRSQPDTFAFPLDKQ
jgi:UDP-2-acetamido-2,6-beta-L-arabino-hexul-4-ose reductase